MHNPSMKPFPIPVVATFGPGSALEDDEPLAYLPMPQAMQTYHAPSLPEPEALAAQAGAVQALQQTLARLRGLLAGAAFEPVDLAALGAAERDLVNQVLGEGEVAVQVDASAAGRRLQIQESVFAGIWRVLELDATGVVGDHIEAGPIPLQVLAAAATTRRRERLPLDGAPDDVMNAPSLLSEIDDQWRRRRSGDVPHVINLTLLPLTPGDVRFLDERLGSGGVRVLSRGYGNCRITNTALPATWRVTYFNSQDTVILDTIEICDLPEVACAARQDLEDSAERLAEVLEWVARA